MSETFLILRITARDVIINVHSFTCKVPVFTCKVPVFNVKYPFLHVKYPFLHVKYPFFLSDVNPLKPELNPICYLLALLGAHHFRHVSRIRVKLLTLR